jgi:hypothetical protein
MGALVELVLSVLATYLQWRYAFQAALAFLLVTVLWAAYLVWRYG